MSSQNSPILQLTDVTMRRDRRMVLDHVNLTVDKGDFVAITGPNGGGKTTLLRIILGLLKPTSGSVMMARDLSVGYLPQKNMIDSHFPISVKEVVMSGLLSQKGLSKKEVATRTDEILDMVGMSLHAHRPIGELSGGQLQRALLGRAIISRPQLLALDEPLSYIDKRFEERLYGLIKRIAQQSTILLVSHEMSEIAGMANRHIIVDCHLHECSALHHWIRSECD